MSECRWITDWVDGLPYLRVESERERDARDVIDKSYGISMRYVKKWDLTGTWTGPIMFLHVNDQTVPLVGEP